MSPSHSDTLLAALMSATSLRHHIVTVRTTHAMSTAVDRRTDGYAVEHPRVTKHLAMVVAGGNEAAVVLRSFTDDISHTLANGTTIPVKHVCGWAIHGGTFHPLDAGQMFAAFHTDADSGEPVAPEPGVEIVDAWAVDLTDFHALSPDDG